MKIFTIGHSTRPVEEFVDLLKNNGIKRLVDIRSIPRSRRNPQYEQTALEKTLPENGVEYIYMKELGGLRPKAKESVNEGWRNTSFRNYADYMQTEEFQLAVDKLVGLAKEKTTAIMCAEAVPWRCHRSLVSDALIIRGVKVMDIMSLSTVTPHKLTPFAMVYDTSITYPSSG